jgi:phosphoribosylformimino-5-aminoimidazole carboxamide ribotide isomerase
LFPAIDLLHGRAVRLHKGERATAKVYAEDPAAQARAFASGGATVLHVVDLDAAFGEARQLEVIANIARCGVPVQVGGGIRDLRSAEEAFLAGAARVIFGSAVVEEPSLAGEAVRKFGPDRVACGIDVKDGRAAVKGWTKQGSRTAAELAGELAGQNVSWLIVTAVSRDGTQAGFDLELLREVAQAAPNARIVASGGAGTLEHLRALRGLPGIAGAIAGTALYEHSFTLREAQEALC